MRLSPRRRRKEGERRRLRRHLSFKGPILPLINKWERVRREKEYIVVVFAREQRKEGGGGMRRRRSQDINPGV